MNERFRLRLKLPSGAEMEAEGAPEFVEAERRAFIQQAARPSETENFAAGPGQGQPAGPPWAEITETRSGGIQLRAKPPGRTERDACLLLLAAAHRLLNTPKPTAAQLARWLRASGYPVGRVDRVLAQALDQGHILASGSRRARRYELTGPGRAKAFLLAEELAKTVSGTPRKS
ncbi:MAG: hypothetical protein NTX64_15000 [Elusimicrobia bacterium]|nr:hypothetical protein [Elusimicrobiota bacterium]